ncbi:MAG: YheU family protein [Pseudohongiellaceae bacterium]
MEIPFNQLPSDTLKAIIEDYVTREGTDYGHQDYSLENKIEQVLASLKNGKAIITFDEDSETCSIVAKD